MPSYGKTLALSFLFKFWNAVSIELNMPLDAYMTATASPDDIVGSIHHQASPSRFLISGIIHAAGDGMMNPRYLGISLPFFFYQAVAITFESIVISFMKKSGFPVPSFFARCVGYGWVILWFIISMPAFLNMLVESGLSRSTAFPFSPAKALSALEPWWAWY
jgi:hypothetical protein